MVISDMDVRYGKLSLSLSLFARAIVRSAIRAANGFALATVLLASAAVYAQETLPPPYQRDGEIYFKEKPGGRVPFPGEEDSSVYCLQANSRLEYIGKNRRTVGTGLRNETVDGNGALIGAESLIENQLLAREARIRVTTFGNCGIEGRGLTAWVFVNEETVACRAREPLTFSEYPAQISQDHLLHFSAACLRYGVRESPDAAEPTPKENRIIIVPDSAPVKIIPLEPHTNVANVALTGTVDWWKAALPAFVSTLEQYDEEAARKSHPYDLVVEFEALAPIALVHGYASSVEYFERDTEPSAVFGSFAGYLREKKFAFEALHDSKDGSHSQRKNKGYQQLDQPNPDCSLVQYEKHLPPVGDPEQMGDVIFRKAKLLAKRHGADHVHLVAHSLGGVWSRAAMVIAKQQEATPDGIGFYSLTTITTPHHGSVFSDIKDTYKVAWKRAFLNPLTLYPDFWKGIFGEWNETTEHARTDFMRGFNAENDAVLPEEFTIKGQRHKVQYTAIAADANIDGSTQDPQKSKFSGYGTIECSAAGSLTDECAGNRSCKHQFLGLDVTGWVLQNRYSMLQRLEGVKTSRVLGLNWWKVATMSRNAAPELNDFTVATNSAKHARFTQFVWGAEENDYYLKNHTVAGRRWLANDLASTTLNVRAQGEAHQ